MNYLNRVIFLILVNLGFCSYQINGSGSYRELGYEQILAQLFSAAKNGNLELLTELLALPLNRDNINVCTVDGDTLLIVAAQNGQTLIVRFLLEMPGIDINLQNKEGETALMAATLWGHEDIVSLLLEHPEINIEAQNIHGENAHLLARFYPKIEAIIMSKTTELRWFRAAEKNDIATIQALIGTINVNLTNSSGNTALTLAASRGSTEIAKFLLKQSGINVNAQNMFGDTALILATGHERKNIIKSLLAVPGINVNIQDKAGDCALSLATLSGNVTITKLLLEVPDINVNAQDEDGDSPLLLSAAQGNESIVKLLLQMPDIKVNIRDKTGNTALINAVHAGNNEIAMLLAQHPGIDINAQDEDYLTAFMHAAESAGSDEIVKFLLEIPGIMIYKALILPRCVGTTRELIKKKIEELTLRAFEAIKHNNIEAVKLITTQIGIDNIVDPDGNTLVDAAFQSHNRDIIEFLLQHAQDPTQLLTRFPFEYMNPTAPIFQYLINLAYGAESFRPDIFNAIKHNNTAELYNKIQQMESVSKKINLNFCDALGYTPLEKAIKKNNLSMVHLILSAHPEILYNLIKSGKNPIALAAGNLEILNLFMDLAYGVQETQSRKRMRDGEHTNIQLECDLHAKVCANCRKPNCIKRCSSCKKVYYCSSPCQKAHWKKHKQDCRLVNTKRAKS